MEENGQSKLCKLKIVIKKINSWEKFNSYPTKYVARVELHITPCLVYNVIWLKNH